MAKKKKGNMRNIQSGDTVQFLNYLTPDHILRGKYNTGNNELDITDVPANLNSVITLGQGGGGGLDNPLITLNVINNGSYSFEAKKMGFLCVANNSIAFDEDTVIEGNSTGILNLFGYLYGDDYLYDIGEYLNVSDFMSSFGDEVNCTINDYDIIVTDPSKPASCTLTLADGI